MKRSLYLLALSVASLVFLSSTCSHSDDNPARTPDNTTLKCSDFFQYDEWTSRLASAQVRTMEKIETFQPVGATFKIKCTYLYLDTNHSALLNACITLLKGAENCEFRGYILKDQYNQDSGDNVNTFGVVNIECVKRNTGRFEMHDLQYTLFSQGTIKELTPSGSEGRSVNIQ